MTVRAQEGGAGVRPTAYTKESFFHAAATSPTWWSEWGNGSGSIYDTSLLARSKTIADLLREAYQVDVPFDGTYSGKVYGAVYDSQGQRIAGDWCAKVAANLLSRTLASATAVAYPLAIQSTKIVAVRLFQHNRS